MKCNATQFTLCTHSDESDNNSDDDDDETLRNSFKTAAHFVRGKLYKVETSNFESKQTFDFIESGSGLEGA